MSSSFYAGRVRTRSCALVIMNDEILLVKQLVPTREQPIWLPPGGEVKIGETAKEAAKRETFEETGIRIKPTHLVVVHEFIEPPFHAVEHYFLSEFVGGSLKVGRDPELSEDDQQIIQCEFVPLNQLHSYRIYPEFLKSLSTESNTFTTGNIPHFVTRTDLHT